MIHAKGSKLRHKINEALYWKHFYIYNYGMWYESWAISFSLTFMSCSLQIGPIRIALHWKEY